MSAVQEQKPKDPNWVCTFSLKKNSQKTEKKHPDLILVDSEKVNKAGKPFKKNFTVNGVWMEASGYFQEDKSLKITIKKSSGSGSTPPSEDGFADQF